MSEKYKFSDPVSLNFVTPIEVTHYKRAPVGVCLALAFFLISMQGLTQTTFETGYSLQKKFEDGGFINDTLFLLAEKIYLEYIVKDSTDYAAHYNLGTLYYNKAAYYDSFVYENKKKLSKKEIRKYDLQIENLIEKARPHFVIYGNVYKAWRESNKNMIGIWKNDK